MIASAPLSRSEALERILTVLEAGLPDDAKRWWAEARAKANTGDAAKLGELFPALRRKLGPEPLVEPEDDRRYLHSEDANVDLAAYRRADAGALLLVNDAVSAGADLGCLRDLYDHGDMNERTAVLRVLPFAGEHPIVADLLGEAQRSNTGDHVEAAFCDNDIIVRRLDGDDFNRAILKMAFVDLPEWRVLGWIKRANPELSRMLQDFATEREAAGRAVWLGTIPFIAHAPVDGTAARIVGHLEHGDDQQRRAAAEHIHVLAEPGLGRYVSERIEREPRPDIRAALEHALEQLNR